MRVLRADLCTEEVLAGEEQARSHEFSQPLVAIVTSLSTQTISVLLCHPTYCRQLTQ